MDNRSGNEIIWFLFGGLVGFTFLSLIITVLAIYIEPNGMLVGIKDYQTLIAGVLAILAAVFSVWIMQRQTAAMDAQIQQTELHEKDRKERRDVATRAVLPHELSKITRYAQSCVVNVFLVLDQENSHRNEHDPWAAPVGGMPKLPELSDNVITVLRDNIEASLDENARHKLQYLIQILQIQRSRLSEFCSCIESKTPFSPVSRQSMEGCCGDAIEVLALTFSLFRYARPKPDYIPTPLAQTDYERAAGSCAEKIGSIVGAGDPLIAHERLGEIVRRRWGTDS